MLYNILIVEDEKEIADAIEIYLKTQNYNVFKAHHGAEGLDVIEKHDIHLAIVDIMMPGLDGWALTREIRKFSSVPIIMLSARAEDFDMLEGFEAGIDEYVTKPFSPAVLVKRVEALLKLSAAKHIANVACEKFKIDRESYTVIVDGQTPQLTIKEFELLCALYDNRGNVLSRDQLLTLVWGYDYYGDERTVDSHIARLRTKLGDFGATHLKTIYGMGYKLELEKD